MLTDEAQKQFSVYIALAVTHTLRDQNQTIILIRVPEYVVRVNIGEVVTVDNRPMIEIKTETCNHKKEEYNNIIPLNTEYIDPHDDIDIQSFELYEAILEAKEINPSDIVDITSSQL